MRLYIIFLLLAFSLSGICQADIVYDIVVGDGTSYANLSLDNQKILVDGGSIKSILAKNQSTVDIVSTAVYPGLSVGIEFATINSSTINVLGGTFRKISTGGNNARLYMSGGIITWGIDIEGTSVQAHFTGGEIPNIALVGPHCDLHFWGSNFTYQKVDYFSFLVTGIWENGDAFSTTVDNYYPDTSRIIFHEVPEPATLALLGLGGLGLRKRRR